MTSTTPFASKATGAILGTAYGDAWGYETEFLSFRDMTKRLRKVHLRDIPKPRKMIITDDTQMSLYLWKALDDTADLDDREAFATNVGKRFMEWHSDPDNDRAPGNACMTSLGRYRSNLWGASSISRMISCTGLDSKGCGTVMRAPWLGLYPRIERQQISPLTQVQALATHGHPTAIVAAVVAAELAWDLSEGTCTMDSAAKHAIGLAKRFVYDIEALDELWMMSGKYDSIAEFSWTGVIEVVEALEKISECLAVWHRTSGPFDPCHFTGQGWTAETCLATALAVAMHAVDNSVPMKAPALAAITNGDSDSIGALAGAFVGASVGNVWPPSWFADLEPRYRDELESIIKSVEDA